MAVGYGDCDDPSQIATIRVEEQVALVKVSLTREGRTHCLNCDKLIPEERRKALPSAIRCVECQEQHGDTQFTAKQPWAT